ncbi:MAG: LuxR family transcriptional regulator [Ilumatobacteraceae bacterium]|nr:LuxR family transcriptional regulator [Ilumatobacteraceae bacterium]
MLLERDRELDVLNGLLDDVAASGGKVVLIRGEAGIGKSALVAEFADARSASATFLCGWCDDLSIPEPLGPIWDLARSAPHLGEPLRAGDRMSLMKSLLDVLSQPNRPTVLVLEDTHWADEATLDVIKYIGRRIAPTNSLLLLTYRDGEVDSDHPLRHVIGELQPGSIARLHLEPFTRDAVASIIDSNLFDVDEVFHLTAGNPLFVLELLDSAPPSVPASVQDAVLARSSKLSIAARSMLELVAVVPGGLEQRLLTDMRGECAELIAECVRQGLLHAASGTVSFRHELARQAVESALEPASRQRLNQQMVQATRSSNPSRVVHHAVRAGDVASIVEFAPVAARAALEVGSLSEALAHYRVLQPHLDQLPEPERAAAVFDWARSEFYLDDPGAVGILDQAIELHRSRGDDLALARALTFAVRVNEVNGQPHAAEAHAAEALKILEALPPGPDLAAALAHRGWLANMRWDEDLALDFAQRAYAVAQGAGDERSMIQALITEGGVRFGRGDRAGLALIRDANARAERGQFWFEATRALTQLNAAAIQQLDLATAEDAARRATATAARYEIHVLEAFGKVQVAETLLLRGEWAQAEDLASEGLDSNPHSRVFARWVLGRIQTRTGRPDARKTITAAWTDATVSGELQNLLPAGAAAAEHMWLTGDLNSVPPDDLVEVLHLACGPASRAARGDLAWWLWASGVIAEVPDDVLTPYVLASTGRAREAADAWEQLGMPYERAIALSMADTPGRLESVESLETLGAIAVASKLRQQMRSDGIVVPRGRSQATRHHRAGLTARQAEVLHLLTEGLSNTEIADRLFVSPRTVENHVSAVLSKLDAATRDEAVQRARRLDIITR